MVGYSPPPVPDHVPRRNASGSMSGCSGGPTAPGSRTRPWSAAARSYGLHVEAGTFEEWDAAGRTFDLLIAGQAWHWVDPEPGARKAAAVLRPGALAAMFWNQARQADGVREAIEGVYARLAP